MKKLIFAGLVSAIVGIGISAQAGVPNPAPETAKVTHHSHHKIGQMAKHHRKHHKKHLQAA